MQGGIPTEGSNDKTVDALALMNLQNKSKGGFHGNCNTCGKKGHRAVDCRVKKPTGNETNPLGDENKETCTYCHREGHNKSTCYIKPGNPG